MGGAWRWVRRMVAGDWFSGDTLSAAGSRAALALAALSILVLGIVDYATGPELSLALFYLIPTTIGTVVASRRAGLGLALESGVTTTIAALVNKSGEPLVSVLNGFLLLLILAVLILLIATIRDSALTAAVAAHRRREFLAYAAHQLRTPLAGIRASTDALLVSGAPSQQERLLVNLSQEADRAGRLLTSLLQMARVDQGEMAPAQALDVVAMCRGELERPDPSAGSVTVRLVVEDAPPGPVLLSGEATKNALANLVDNARRHASREVTVTVRATASTVEIAVADDGQGVPDAQAERLFDRFVSLDGQGGSGLGLPIARGLIEAQGGKLTYEAPRFVIRLPFRRS
jgi:signal transduction histidine kinase